MFEKKGKPNIPEERKQAIFLKIKPIIAQQLEMPESSITLASRLVEDLGADSLDSIEITMGMEEEFNIEIDDVDGEKMKTIDDIIIYLAERVTE